MGCDRLNKAGVTSLILSSCLDSASPSPLNLAFGLKLSLKLTVLEWQCLWHCCKQAAFSSQSRTQPLAAGLAEMFPGTTPPGKAVEPTQDSSFSRSVVLFVFQKAILPVGMEDHMVRKSCTSCSCYLGLV